MLRTAGKQTQSNPTCSELVEPISKGAPMLPCTAVDKFPTATSISPAPSLAPDTAHRYRPVLFSGEAARLLVP